MIKQERIDYFEIRNVWK